MRTRQKLFGGLYTIEQLIVFCFLIAGISAGHRRDVQRYSGREVEMGVPYVRRRRKRSDRHTRDDENSSSEYICNWL